MEAGLDLGISFWQGSMAWEAGGTLLGTQFHVLNKQLEFNSHFHVARMFHLLYGALECLAGTQHGPVVVGDNKTGTRGGSSGFGRETQVYGIRCQK